MAVTSLRKLASDNQKRQSKQNPQTLSTSFSRVLEEAAEKQRQPIQVQTTGYTKDARFFYNFVSKREYVQ